MGSARFAADRRSSSVDHPAGAGCMISRPAASSRRSAEGRPHGTATSGRGSPWRDTSTPSARSPSSSGEAEATGFHFDDLVLRAPRWHWRMPPPADGPTAPDQPVLSAPQVPTMRLNQAVLVLAAYGLLAALRDDTPAVLDVARFPADGKNRMALLSAQGAAGRHSCRFPLVRWHSFIGRGRRE
jgi:hypothetical protein